MQLGWTVINLNLAILELFIANFIVEFVYMDHRLILHIKYKEIAYYITNRIASGVPKLRVRHL